MPIPKTLIAGAALIGSFAAASAADLLPLDRGVYSASPCKSRSRADSRWFLGDKLNTSTAACKITKLKVVGQTYSYVQDCLDTSENAPLKEPITLIVKDRKRFALAHDPDYYGKTQTEFRWCEAL